MARSRRGGEGFHISLTEPGVARAVFGSAHYLTGVTVMASGFGWLLRNTAGALSVLLGVLVVLPLVGFVLPAAVAQVVIPYLPNNAGTAIMQLTPGGMLPPWTGFGVFSLTPPSSSPPARWLSADGTPEPIA
jgi:ABC-2 type transport system permease protein